jgi:hypothetical protein
MPQDDDRDARTTLEADALLIKQYSDVLLEEIEDTELREAVASAEVRVLDHVIAFVTMMQPIAADHDVLCTTLSEAVALYQEVTPDRDPASAV